MTGTRVGALIAALVLALALAAGIQAKMFPKKPATAPPQDAQLCTFGKACPF